MSEEKGVKLTFDDAISNIRTVCNTFKGTIAEHNTISASIGIIHALKMERDNLEGQVKELSDKNSSLQEKVKRMK